MPISIPFSQPQGARACDRILKVARTIADLAGDDHIRQSHLYEAISRRTLNRTLSARRCIRA